MTHSTCSCTPRPPVYTTLLICRVVLFSLSCVSFMGWRHLFIILTQASSKYHYNIKNMNIFSFNNFVHTNSAVTPKPETPPLFKTPFTRLSLLRVSRCLALIHHHCLNLLCVHHIVKVSQSVAPIIRNYYLSLHTTKIRHRLEKYVSFLPIHCHCRDL